MAEVPVIYYNNAVDGEIKSRWWKQDKDEMYRHVFGVVQNIWQYQKYHELSHIRYARLYHNMELVSLRAGMFARSAGGDAQISNRVTLNVIKSCIDTATSKIGKSRPRPMFLTDDGNWGKQHKAELRTQFMEGWFEEEDIYAKGTECFRDACVFGTGVMKLYADKGRIKAERVIIDEIIVDDTEGRYMAPRQMHQVKLVFREVLLDLFPDKKNFILSASSGLSSEEQRVCSADMIKVVESWHLKSGEEQDDGVHCISIENATLFEESYEKDYFPFVFFRWTPKLLGFYGQGLAEELVGLQLEINKILRNIQIAQHLMAVPQVWLEATSHVVAAHINNEIGGIKRYVGTPPVFSVPPAMSPEIYSYLQYLYQKAYEITGISQMTANSQKPAGVTAAVAMRELSDIQSERFEVVGQMYERFYMQITEMGLDKMADLYNDDPSFGVRIRSGSHSQRVKWKEVVSKEDDDMIRVYPTNLLPSTPAGKLEKVQELLQAGFLERDEALSLLDFPDTKAVTSLKTAPRDDIMRLIYLMIDKGQYYSPEPYMNLQMAITLTQSAYNKARTNNVPEDRLELLRRFMDDIKMLLAPDQGMQLPPGAGGMMPAPGPVTGLAQPEAAPVSDLLPLQGQ